MTTTPGQAAYEAYEETNKQYATTWPWTDLRPDWQAAWEAAAQAAITAYLAAQHGPWAERAAEILTQGQP